MVHLLFSILSSTSIMIIFKTIERLKINIFYVIIINYAIAFPLGLLLNKGTGAFNGFAIIHAPWFYFSILVGVCMIAMFFVIGISTQKAGVSATAISGRISVVIPMLFSIFYYDETLNMFKAVGMVLAPCALICTALKKKRGKGFDKRNIYLPLSLFIGLGVLDAIVKFVQHEYLSDGNSAGFTSALFFFAFIFFKERLSALNWIGVTLSIAAIAIFINA